MDESASESREPTTNVETDGSGETRSSVPPSADHPDFEARERDTAERTETIGRPDTAERGDPPREDREPRFAIVRRWVGALGSSTRLGQFLSIGVLGALFDNGLLVVLYGVGGLSLATAKLASAEAAILLMFACNERFTFAEWTNGGNRDLARRVLTSNLVRLGGVAVATGVLVVLAELGIWYVLANVIGIGVGALLNYVLESSLTWRVHRE